MLFSLYREQTIIALVEYIIYRVYSIPAVVGYCSSNNDKVTVA